MKCVKTLLRWKLDPIQVFLPDSVSNPIKDSWYLRHILHWKIKSRRIIALGLSFLRKVLAFPDGKGSWYFNNLWFKNCMIILWLLFVIIKITSLVTFIILLFCFDAPPLILLHTPSIPILPPNLIQIGRSDSLVVASWESGWSPFKPKRNWYTDVEFVTRNKSRARVKHF